MGHNNIDPSRKHAVARMLDKIIKDNGFGTKTLAKAAKVTQEYVWYIRNFATKPEQIEYLVYAAKKYSKSNEKKPYTIYIRLPEPILEKLREKRNISKQVRKIYEQWHSEHGSD